MILTVAGGGGSGVGAPFLSPFLLFVGEGGGPGSGVDGGGVYGMGSYFFPVKHSTFDRIYTLFKF